MSVFEKGLALAVTQDGESHVLGRLICYGHIVYNNFVRGIEIWSGIM